jgi:uncharacterized protein YbjQ (UPF0145 family)
MKHALFLAFLPRLAANDPRWLPGGGKAMIATTTENVPGYRVREVKGSVFGLVVRSRGLLPNFIATLRSYKGGEIKEYTRLLEQGRRDAIERMEQNALAMGANAVVMMRFDSSSIDHSFSEIVAYGTAVVLEKIAP